MKFTAVSGLSLLAATAIAAPTASHDPYEPVGGWESIDYPDGTGENLDSYPAPPGGWENVEYPPGTGAGDYQSKECTNGPFKFTSTYHVVATPDQVINGTTPTGGLAGAIGYYDLGLNSDLDLICYNIKLVGFRGEYSSPAATATHLHEALKGASGPPRIAFPNPVGDEKEAISVGCLKGPFTTGLRNATTGIDSGVGFTIAMIEANPARYMTDVHSSLALPGAVRGQLA